MLDMAVYKDLAWHLVDHVVKVGLPIGLIAYLMVPVGAILAFRQQQARHDIGHGVRAFLRYCLSFDTPMSWTAKFKSVRLDIGFVIVKKFVTDWLLIPILLSTGFAAALAYQAMTGVFGAHEQNAPGWVAWACLVAGGVLVSDFTQFLIHWAHHRYMTLWDIHKVHHSTEFMVFSLSVKRTHAIEEFINISLAACTVGATIGVLSWLMSVRIWDSLVFGIDAWMAAHLLSFWHLRHSHMSLAYGWLEHVLQSPAQHQLHHSAEARHRGKNFGLVFSFWDKLFGSFEPSEDPRSFRLGLSASERPHYDSVAKLYLTPVRRMAKRLGHGVARRYRAKGIVARQPGDAGSTPVVADVAALHPAAVSMASSQRALQHARVPETV